ncbi:MAG: putative toxin-antitoxin system toxin component, PIN family [Candidatus Anammoxibacter sp.]
MKKIVVDTNVVVSSLLNEDSIPASIIHLVLQGKVTLCLSNDIFSEYKGVLSRKKFSHLDQPSIKSLLPQLKKKSLLVKPTFPIEIITNDPADNKFLECALVTKADFLVTGNSKHFPFKKFHNTRIVTPKEFLILIIKTIVKEK